MRCSKPSAMNVSLAQAAAALNATSQWEERIAENMAASSVPGYKKQDVAVSMLNAGQLPGSPSRTQALLLPRAARSTNFSPGDEKHTGVETDVALDGPGFLPVQLPSGETAYTRDGELRIDATGQLVTKQGYPVLGQSGTIQLDLNNAAPVTISAAGEVSQGTETRGALKAVEFQNPELLTPVSRGFFVASHPDVVAQDSDQTHFHQGYLEAANTSPALEMAQLITAMRIFEANQRSMQAHDTRMEQAIRALGPQ
jgi:flagellar basal-body rod protein FlgG